VRFRGETIARRTSGGPVSGPVLLLVFRRLTSICLGGVTNT